MIPLRAVGASQYRKDVVSLLEVNIKYFNGEGSVP